MCSPLFLYNCFSVFSQSRALIWLCSCFPAHGAAAGDLGAFHYVRPTDWTTISDQTWPTSRSDSCHLSFLSRIHHYVNSTEEKKGNEPSCQNGTANICLTGPTYQSGPPLEVVPNIWSEGTETDLFIRLLTEITGIFCTNSRTWHGVAVFVSRFDWSTVLLTFVVIGYLPWHSVDSNFCKTTSFNFCNTFDLRGHRKTVREEKRLVLRMEPTRTPQANGKNGLAIFQSIPCYRNLSEVSVFKIRPGLNIFKRKKQDTR